ncbi:MAG: ankyrin repeat domain-containing protein [Legionellaceae bacterium]|nr:ankyrin repeat domain-containing protein [Legionellaceae bacterium]
MLKMLLEIGAVDTPVNGEYVFDKAVRNGRLDIMQLFVKVKPGFWAVNGCFIEKWIGLAAGHMVKDCFDSDSYIWEPGWPEIVTYLASSAKLNNIELSSDSQSIVNKSQQDFVSSNKHISISDWIASGANLDELINNPGHPSHGKTEVQWAYECGKYITMGILLDAGALVDESTAQSLIFEAVKYARVDTIERLFDDYPNLKNYSYTGFWWGDTAIQNLLSHNDFVEYKLPFIFAVRHGYMNIVIHLIESGININYTVDDFELKNTYGKTALRLAYEAAQYSIVEILLKSGAKDLPFKQNYLIHTAAENGHLKILKLILKNNPELLDKTNSSGKTPLLLACEKAHRAVINYLVEIGASVSSLYAFTMLFTDNNYKPNNTCRSEKILTPRQKLCRQTNAFPGGFVPKWLRKSSMWSKSVMLDEEKDEHVSDIMHGC